MNMEIGFEFGKKDLSSEILISKIYYENGGYEYEPLCRNTN